MLSLSHREARGLASFLEVLASPLTFPDSSAWRREVMSRGRAVFRAERTVFTLDWERPRALEEEGLDPGAIPAYQAYYYRLDAGHDERRRRRRTVLGHCLQLAEGWEIGPPEFREDFLRRYGLDRGAGVAHDVAPRVCAWCNFYPDAEPREEFEARVLPLLELASPVFRAGIETLRRTAAVRAEFLRLLDVVSDGLVLVDSGGHVLHQNPALTRIQHVDPEWPRLKQALNATRRRLRAGTRDLRNLIESTTMTIATERASYEVIATVPGPDLMASGVFLLLQVLIRPSTLPSTQMLSERFELTRREAEVARCLAQGLSYARTADHLRISIDTVRSHVRSIYATLQVQSATEAVSRILRETR